jgi:hypothetical protein
MSDEIHGHDRMKRASVNGYRSVFRRGIRQKAPCRMGKVTFPRSSAEAGPMRSSGESSLRIVSEEQAHALASAALD